MFPGSFDPFTIGHYGIVERALGLFDRVVIAIGENNTKQPIFPLDERLTAIRKAFADEPRVDDRHREVRPQVASVRAS